LGNTGGLGMIIGLKVSPHPVQIMYTYNANPSQKSLFIQTP
jgi:hypothetical protein